MTFQKTLPRAGTSVAGPVLLALPGLLVFALCAFGFAAEAAAQATSQVEAPPADPGSPSLRCSHRYFYRWDYPGDGVGSVSARVRFGTDSCNAADGPAWGSPILIFAHGEGMDLTSHDELMIHLARNGFVVASVANSGSNEERARQLVSFLNGLNEYWTFRHRLSRRVAFAGHSRGGEAAVTAARLIAEERIEAYPYLVRAVLSIAPTDGGHPTSPAPRETLTGAMTDGYFALYGSRDADVQGSTSRSNTEPQRTAFALYDRAGSEWSPDGYTIGPSLGLDKAFVFLIGAGHRAFVDPDQFGSTVEGLSAAKAYFNGFLRWKVLRDPRYAGYFDGRWRPASLIGAEIVQQVSAGQRRVIDNFENGSRELSSVGDQVLISDDFGLATEGPMWTLASSSPHDTGGMRLTWYESGDRFVGWVLPDTENLAVGRVRNLSQYTHLSLRVAQVYANSYNTAGADQDFHVLIYSARGASNLVRLGLYGRIPYPDEFECDNLIAQCVGNFTKSAMSTVRIPFTAFGNVDWSDVRWIAIAFGRGDAPATGSITIDSLEVVQGPIGGPTIFGDGFESGTLAGWN